MKKALFAVISILVLTALACGFNVSTANISDAKMARDAEGNDPTTVFAQDDIFYAVVDLANAPDDTTVKAVWIAVDADGVDPNLTIDEVELTSGGGQLNFELSNDKKWPAGKYKVDLLLNNELDRSLDFEVEGDAVAEEPAAETVEEEPTATPEPMATPEPTATPEPEPTVTPQSSTGDSLGGSTGDTLGGTSDKEKDTESPPAEGVVLPFEDEAYMHPSGAFSFPVPEGWELNSEDELSAAFGDDLSRVGVIFVNNPDATADDEAMLEFVDTSLEIIVDSFADSYEVIADNNLLEENDLYFITVGFADGDGQADFFFERHGSIVFILYFASFIYDEMDPTWGAIIDNYQIDVDAALAATPVDEPTPTPMPTPRPVPPTPTPKPAPATNRYAPPPGGARVYLVNSFTHEFNIDFGDGAGSIQVPPGTEEMPHDIAPGSYRPGLSVAGGNAINIDIIIGADQSWVVLVDEGGSVKTGQVYP